MRLARRLAALIALIWAALAAPVLAQSVPAPATDIGLSALARVVPGAERLRPLPDGSLALDLGLSQAVPWRMRERADPPRLLVDFREVDFTGLDRRALLEASAGRFVDLRAGPLAEGWSRLVIELDAPFAVTQAGLRTGLGESGSQARLSLRLTAEDPQEFARRAALPDPETWTMAPPERPRIEARPRPDGGPLVVVLDPGHGGIDPGAERGGVSEAALMLTFARELKEALVRAGGFEVVLTREGDVFVPLESRIAFADAAGAHVFLSLHADAIPEGIATGAAVYTMDETATDEASAALAERHDRDTLMAGADLSGQDDQVANVLMDLARLETTPRARHLAQELLLAMAGRQIVLHKQPQRQAAFSVLKLPHVPSALIELGYLSSERDLKRLTDPAWRARMAQAIVAGLQEWALRDAALAGLRRQ